MTIHFKLIMALALFLCGRPVTVDVVFCSIHILHEQNNTQKNMKRKFIDFGVMLKRSVKNFFSNFIQFHIAIYRRLINFNFWLSKSEISMEKNSKIHEISSISQLNDMKLIFFPLYDFMQPFFFMKYHEGSNKSYFLYISLAFTVFFSWDLRIGEDYLLR